MSSHPTRITAPGVPSSCDVVVVGAGVIGLSCAWRLAERGLSVALVDPDPGHGASWAAAGMLAPTTEASYGEEQQLRLGLAGAARWPSYAAELATASGCDPGLREQGTLVVAHDAGDKAELDRFAAYGARLGLTLHSLSGRECRRLEPLLAPDVRGGLLAADRSAHNRLTVAALIAACQRSGVRLLATTVERIETTGPSAALRVSGVRLADGSGLRGEHVVVAAGSWSPLLAGLPEDVVPPVRPVRGTVLRLMTPPDYRGAGVLSRTLRGTVAGAHVYLVPREDGEVVVGATMEEAGYDDRPTAGGVWELLRDARLLLPVISELTFVEAWSGLRPATPDNAPVVGPTAVAGLVMATGHGRNGILLAPVTADAVVAVVTEDVVPDALQAFSPLRFSHAQAST
ncbi:MAG: glycine oxidase ThiO [Candidatus Nanopelagicales bacterium]